MNRDNYINCLKDKTTYSNFSNEDNIFERYFNKFNQRYKRSITEEEMYNILKNREISLEEAKNLIKGLK